MSAKEYIDNEIEKIINSDVEYPLNMAYAATWILANFKGVNIKIFKASESKDSSLSDYYVIASMDNTTQANAALDAVLNNLKNHGMKNISTEGRELGEWMLIDLGDIIVHIFQDAAREIYDLDRLWMDIPQVKIPEEYYYSDNTQTVATTNSTIGYF